MDNGATSCTLPDVASDQILAVPPGWYVTLIGEKRDLRTWSTETMDLAEAQLREGPFDQWFLSSGRFTNCGDHYAVRGHAYALVDDLNVRMAELHAALPLNVNTVAQVRPDGSQHSYHSIYISLQPRENAPFAQGRAKDDIMALPLTERVRSLLTQFAKANDWPAIFSTIELAEKLVYGQNRKRLWNLVEEPKLYGRLRGWANSFRHPALDKQVPAEVTMAEAHPLLRIIV